MRFVFAHPFRLNSGTAIASANFISDGKVQVSPYGAASSYILMKEPARLIHSYSLIHDQWVATIQSFSNSTLWHAQKIAGKFGILCCIYTTFIKSFPTFRFKLCYLKVIRHLCFKIMQKIDPLACFLARPASRNLYNQRCQNMFTFEKWTLVTVPSDRGKHEKGVCFCMILQHKCLVTLRTCTQQLIFVYMYLDTFEIELSMVFRQKLWV